MATEDVCPASVIEAAQMAEEEEMAKVKERKKKRRHSCSPPPRKSITPDRATTSAPCAPSPAPVSQQGPPCFQAVNHQPTATAFQNSGDPAMFQNPGFQNLPSSTGNLNGLGMFPYQLGYNFPGFGFGTPQPPIPFPIPPSVPPSYPGFLTGGFNLHLSQPSSIYPTQPYPSSSEFPNWQPPQYHYSKAPWQQPRSSYQPTRPDVERPYRPYYNCSNLGPTFYPDDPIDFPRLTQWLEDVDQDPECGWWQDDFSQFTARFEMERFTTLLDLEGLTADYLGAITGISYDSARRLIHFATEDIQVIRDTAPRASKRARYN
ncbi:hypothetical protein BJ322DRAFT_1114602 [Thelephora terrestris]|uniref:Uncharacterized protein n=1 Tax=Thelephora terrestris TaxID=56493 RepID=A0A9P6H2H7_9AGAM|nr:hypothetical protein BJ322DRAFT_1114602 [Thelephora terrestris]